MGVREMRYLGLGRDRSLSHSGAFSDGGPLFGGSPFSRGGPLFGGGGGFNTSSNSDRRYNLTLGVGARNVFNNVNVANPNAVLGSKIFDVSNSLQGGPFSQGSSSNRRIELQATFAF